MKEDLVEGRKAPPTNRLVSVDVLRGVAVLAVVITHLPYSLRTSYNANDHSAPVSAVPAWFEHISHYGAFGVHLFLVLSGFCIHIRWAKAKNPNETIDFVPFWKRRLWRLYPPYFVALVASLFGLFLLFAGLSHVPFSAGIAAQLGYPSLSVLVVDLVLLLLLMQNLNGASQRIGNGPFWSLALEEQLYMLYFPLLAVRRRWGWKGALTLAAIVTIGWRFAGAFIAELPSFWYLVGPARWIEWCFGAMVAEAYVGMIELPKWTKSALLGFSALLLGIVLNPPAGAFGTFLRTSLARQLFGDAAFAVCSAILLHRMCQSEKLKGISNGKIVQLLAACGLWSYSIYLTHNPIIVAVKQVAVRLGLPVVAVLGLRLGASIAVGYLFFRLIERRFLLSARSLKKTEAA